MVKAKLNPLNIAIGLVGLFYLLEFGRYCYLNAWRDLLGYVSLLALGASFVPALGCFFGLARPDRTFTGWRVLALVISTGLVAPLLLLWYQH